MVTRRHQFALEEFYHVYNRGTDKRVIFEDQADYRRFQDLLYLCNSSLPINVRDVYRDYATPYEFNRSEPLVAIGAYCQMPNHFHLLLTPLAEGAVGKFLTKLGTSYSMYFNKKNERSGRLFESSFKAQHADTDEYLKYLYAYIHLNPVKLIQSDWKLNGIRNYAEAFKFIENYSFSSLPDYLGKIRAPGSILTSEKFPQYFISATAKREELAEWLQYQDFT